MVLSLFSWGKTESNEVIHDPDFGLTLNRSIKLSR